MARDYINAALKLVEKSTKAFLGSVDDEGYPNVKVMLSPRDHHGIKEFYFTTNTSSMRVEQYQKNPRASVYFFDGRYFRTVMLKGTMEVLHDEETKKHIWRDGDDMYYPLGVTDPDYCVLRFTGERGRFYENFTSTDFMIE